MHSPVMQQGNDTPEVLLRQHAGIRFRQYARMEEEAVMLLCQGKVIGYFDAGTLHVVTDPRIGENAAWMSADRHISLCLRAADAAVYNSDLANAAWQQDLSVRPSMRVVTDESDPLYGLLSTFHKYAGLGMLLEASHVAMTMEQALGHFTQSRIDHLIIGPYLISRKAPSSIDAAAAQTQIIDFIRSIGIEVEIRTIEEETFLPGILIAHGKILVDEQRLRHPGDLLHEAGHLAVVEPARRQELYNSAVSEGISMREQGGEEMAAIAWSYAALTHLGLPPETVFHEDGYHGDSETLVDSFMSGKGPGIPFLDWIGLSRHHKNALKASEAPFPAMIRWMREH